MTLRERQSLFVSLLVHLIDYILAAGYDLTLGEAYRSPEEARRLAKLGKGIAASVHTDRLAIDLNLFKDGVYLTTTEGHREFGEYWETLHPLCRWGGHFKKPDGNHYSLTYRGRA